MCIEDFTRDEPHTEEACTKDEPHDDSELLYTIDETPPWYIAAGLGFQVSS